MYDIISLWCQITAFNTSQPVNLTYVDVHVYEIKTMILWSKISEPYLYIHRLHNISYFRAIGLLKLNLNFRLVDKIFLDVASLSLLVHHYQGVYMFIWMKLILSMMVLVCSIFSVDSTYFVTEAFNEENRYPLLYFSALK